MTNSECRPVGRLCQAPLKWLCRLNKESRNAGRPDAPISLFPFFLIQKNLCKSVARSGVFDRMNSLAAAEPESIWFDSVDSVRFSVLFVSIRGNSCLTSLSGNCGVKF